MVAATSGAALFFHLGLEQVMLALKQLVPHLLVDGLESGVVAVVVVFDDLERPPPFDHIAPDDLLFDPFGQCAMAGLAKTLNCVIECKVGHTGEAMEGIQEAARIFDGFERFRQFAHRGHGGIVDAFGSLVGSVGLFGVRALSLGHRRQSTPQRADWHALLWVRTNDFGPLAGPTGDMAANINPEMIIYVLSVVSVFIASTVVDQRDDGTGFGADIARGGNC